MNRGVFQPEQGRKAVRTGDERPAEKGDARNRADAGVAIGERRPVGENNADDLAESEGDDGEIIAAQPEHREAERDAPERGERPGDRQADPERPAEMRREQRVGVGADRVEGDIAEVKETGEADDDVEAPAEQDVEQDLDAEIIDPFLRAGGAEQRQHHDREGDERGDAGAPGEARRYRVAARRRFGFGRRARRPARKGRDDKADHESRERRGEDRGPAALQIEFVREILVGAPGENREGEAEHNGAGLRGFGEGRAQTAGNAGIRAGTIGENWRRPLHLCALYFLDVGAAEEAGGHENQRDRKDGKGRHILVIA